VEFGHSSRSVDRRAVGAGSVRAFCELPPAQVQQLLRGGARHRPRGAATHQAHRRSGGVGHGEPGHDIERRASISKGPGRKAVALPADFIRPTLPQHRSPWPAITRSGSESACRPFHKAMSGTSGSHKRTEATLEHGLCSLVGLASWTVPLSPQPSWGFSLSRRRAHTGRSESPWNIGHTGWLEM
jgi:hypothetical protein